MSVGGWECSVTGLGKYEIFHFYLADCPFVCSFVLLCVYVYVCEYMRVHVCVYVCVYLHVCE